MNPGPTNYPCSKCHLGVRSGILCTSCNLWIHARCEGLDRQQFNILLRTGNQHFICCVCKDSQSAVSTTEPDTTLPPPTTAQLTSMTASKHTSQATAHIVLPAVPVSSRPGPSRPGPSLPGSSRPGPSRPGLPSIDIPAEQWKFLANGEMLCDQTITDVLKLLSNEHPEFNIPDTCLSASPELIQYQDKPTIFVHA